jgi:hypothetical protein
MALQDVTTPRPRYSILQALPEDVRAAALQAANPQLSSEVQAVATHPNRVRKLTVESVCEMITWIDDYEVIEAIVRHDTRTAVTDAARKRLRDLQVPVKTTPLVANAHNIENRTKRALELPFKAALAALKDLKDVDIAQTDAWVETLSFEEFESALCELISHPELKQSNELLVKRASEVLASKTTVEDMLKFLAEIPRVGFMESLLYAQTSNAWPLYAAVTALVACESSYLPFSSHRLSPNGLTPESAAYWRTEGRTDLLMWAREATLDEVRTELASRSPERIAELARLIYSADQADALVEDIAGREALPLGFYDRSWGTALSCILRTGMRDDTLITLLKTASSDTLAEWVSGKFHKNKPTPELATRLATEVLNATSAFDVLRRSYHAHETGSEVLEALVRAVAVAVPGSASVIFKATSYQYNAMYVANNVAKIAAEMLKDSTEAWSMFWVLFSNDAAGTLHDLLLAAQALTES